MQPRSLQAGERPVCVVRPQNQALYASEVQRSLFAEAAAFPQQREASCCKNDLSENLATLCWTRAQLQLDHEEASLGPSL